MKTCVWMTHVSIRCTTASLLLALLVGPAAGQLGSVRTSNGAPVGTLVIAHRGGAKESTENTIEAFQRAVRIGAAGIETDIRLTKDGVIVVYHDDRFGRVEGLAPAQQTRLVSDMTYTELTAGSLVPVGEDHGGRRVPALEDLLAHIKTGILNIELKRCARFDDLVDRTAKMLKRYAVLDRVVLEAPDLKTAQKLRDELGPGLKLHINPAYDGSVPFNVSLEKVLEFKPHSISVSYRKVSIEIIEQAHKAGVEVWVWTLDSPELAGAMSALGVDAIKTDVPSRLVGILRYRTVR